MNKWDVAYVSVLWLVRMMKRMMAIASLDEVTIPFGRASPYDHHGYYRLAGRNPTSSPLIEHDGAYLEIILYHERFVSDVRSFTGGHVLLYFTFMVVDTDDNICRRFFRQLVCHLTDAQIELFMPAVDRFQLSSGFNMLGNGKWVTPDLQPLHIMHTEKLHPWIREFDNTYMSMRLLAPHMNERGFCFQLVYPNFFMPYIQICLCPENVFSTYHANWHMDPSWNEGANGSLFVEFWASYLAFDLWEDNREKYPWKFCKLRAYYTDFGILSTLNALEMFESKDAFRWLFTHLILKVELQHYENAIFADPMKAMYWFKPLLRSKAANIPKLHCGRIIDWECDPFSPCSRDKVFFDESRLTFEEVSSSSKQQ